MLRIISPFLILLFVSVLLGCNLPPPKPSREVQLQQYTDQITSLYYQGKITWLDRNRGIKTYHDQLFGATPVSNEIYGYGLSIASQVDSKKMSIDEFNYLTQKMANEITARERSVGIQERSLQLQERSLREQERREREIREEKDKRLRCKTINGKTECERMDK